jgi:two-component system response regulator AlgR
MIKVLIVDNELLAGVRIERLLTAMQNIIFVGQATNRSSTMAMVEAQAPDIVLMKTPMPEMGTVSFPKVFNQVVLNPIVVFCPSLDQFECGPLRGNLIGAILSASKEVHNKRRQLYAGARSCLYAYSYQGIDVIPIEDVRLLKADQKYVRVYTANTDFTINESLKGLEQEFPNLFIRIHRNALVTKGAIQGIRRIEGRSLVMLDDIDIQPEISRRLEPKLRKLTAQL